MVPTVIKRRFKLIELTADTDIGKHGRIISCPECCKGGRKGSWVITNLNWNSLICEDCQVESPQNKWLTSKLVSKLSGRKEALLYANDLEMLKLAPSKNFRTKGGK